VSRFDSIVQQFNTLLSRAQQPGLTPVEAMNQFHLWMGQVQQALHLANQEVSESLPGLRAQGEDTLEILQQFGQYQSGVSEAMDEIAKTLKGCSSLQAFQQAESHLLQCMSRIESLGQDLDHFLDGDSEDESGPAGPGPLPSQVRECLDCLEQGMTHLVSYAEQREHGQLLLLSQQLDKAREALSDYLEEHG